MTVFPSILILTEKETLTSPRPIDKFFEGSWNKRVHKYRHRIIGLFTIMSVVGLTRLFSFDILPSVDEHPLKEYRELDDVMINEFDNLYGYGQNIHLFWGIKGIDT